MDASEFFAKPEAATREASRPKAINPLTGKEQSWTRASNYAAELDSPFGLIKRNLRKLIFGLSVRNDLARMLLSGAVQEDQAKTDEVINAALATAEIDASANEGTAAHAALVRSWLGHEVAEEFHPLIASFAKALKAHGLTPKAAELKVMSLRFKSIGTFDWLMEEADGTEVIADVKTGRLDVAKLKFAVQCAMYDDADYVVHPDGTTDPMPWSLAHSHAVLIHIDLETNGVSIYRVDLHIGRHGAALAEQVRAWHKLDPLSPYVPPLTGKLKEEADARNKLAAAGAITREDVGLPSIAPRGQEVSVPAAEVVGEIEVTEPRPTSAADVLDEAQPIDAAIEKAGGPPVDGRFDELMKSYDKAALQHQLKTRFQWMDSNHNRRWLARAIIALEDGVTPASAVVKYAAAKEDGPPPAPPVAPSQKTYDPAGLIVQAISQMKTVDGIRILHDRRVAEHGDQGWTDEMTEAARVRVAELDAQTDTGPSFAASVLRRIGVAVAQLDIKVIWDDVTLNGSDVERWTDEMQAAAEARMVEIRRASEAQAENRNPWG